MSAAVVLAAGEGKRLKTRVPKVLHEAGGRALLDHVLAALAPLALDPVVVVVGHLREQVEAHLAGRPLATAVQDPPRGTGDAVARALPLLPEAGEVLIVSGDTPLLRTSTLAALADLRRREGAEVALTTAVLPDGGGYGRVLRAEDGAVRAIVEARDASAAELAVREVNAGLYVFDLPALRRGLASLRPDNAQGEYYLTDVVADAARQGRRVVALRLEDSAEMAGVNTRAELAEAHRLLNARVLANLQAAGVTVLDASTTWVESGCEVGPDTVLEPGVHLRRGCRLGAGCRVGAHAVIEGTTLPDGARVAPLTLLREHPGPGER